MPPKTSGRSRPCFLLIAEIADSDVVLVAIKKSEKSLNLLPFQFSFVPLHLITGTMASAEVASVTLRVNNNNSISYYSEYIEIYHVSKIFVC